MSCWLTDTLETMNRHVISVTQTHVHITLAT